MLLTEHSIAALAAALRAIAAEETEERDIIRRVMPLAGEMAAHAKDWVEDGYYACDAEQGIGVHLLHEEADHGLAVFAAAWMPGRGAPPHDHGTWAVVAGVDGAECNTNWDRTDDGATPGHAEISRRNEVIIDNGKAVTFLPRDIHSVDNTGDRVTLSLHIYGRHVNHTDRYKFDPEANTAERFVLKVGQCPDSEVQPITVIPAAAVVRPRRAGIHGWVNAQVRP